MRQDAAVALRSNFTVTCTRCLTCMLRSGPMKARKITQKKLVAMVAAGDKPGVPFIPRAKLKWDVAVLVTDCANQKNRFSRSVVEFVDDVKKKSHFLLAIYQLFDAIQDEDYHSALADSGMTCKVAHSFKFNNTTYKVWELKPNNKDRIYFYATDLPAPHRKTIFLLMAFHKKDQNTPPEASGPCEDDVKNILREKGNIEFCKEENDDEK